MIKLKKFSDGFTCRVKGKLSPNVSGKEQRYTWFHKSQVPNISIGEEFTSAGVTYKIISDETHNDFNKKIESGEYVLNE